MKILDGLGLTDADLIDSIVSGKYVVDLGIVTATNQTTVDVKHAVVQQVSGAALPATVTKGVEILWPFPGTWTIAVGDLVLLLGAKDFVAQANGLSAPATTDIAWHYTQETMKAIPIYSASKQAQITIDSSNLVHVKNAAASLFTILNNLLTALNNFSNAAAQSAITTGGSSSASLASAIVVLQTALNSAVSTVTTALGQLLAA